MIELRIGDPAPKFAAPDQDGNMVSLDDFDGKKLVLYFYPKDNTPGCTAEACDLRDNYDKFIAQGYEILGVSADSQKSHQNFIKKYDLPFRLLSDVDKKILESYNAWGEKKMYGKTYMGILRKTFVISEDGIIENIIDKVKTKEHTNQILEG
jgi:peroxiredoxin Q/BCP